MQRYDTVGCCHPDSLQGHLREGFPPPHSTQGFWVLLLLKKKKKSKHKQTGALSSLLYFLSKSNFGFLPSRNLSLNPAQTLQVQEIVLPTASSVANIFYIFLKHCSCKNLCTTINRAVCFWCCVSSYGHHVTLLTMRSLSLCLQGSRNCITFRIVSHSVLAQFCCCFPPIQHAFTQ